MLSTQNPSDSPCSSEVSARKKRSNEKAPDELSLDEADLPTSTLDQLDLLSFSIRDYVCQSRTKSIKQNWPFHPPYLQLCLDHGVTDVLPPFEPPTSFKPWHLLNSDLVRTKVAGEALDLEDDVGGGLQRTSATCVDQLGATSKQEESTSSRPSSSPKGMPESDSTITNDDLVRETLLPPKFVPVGRRKPSVVGASQPAPSFCNSKSSLDVDENCGSKPAKRPGDKSSLTVSKECSEMKPESGRCEGFVSKLSALLDPMASKVCPVCRNFSSTSNTTLNAHIDQCLASDSTTQLPLAIRQRRHKVKPRKMKSIEEIYATARPCTLEHLDRTNGTTGTLNNFMVSLTSEDFRENKRTRPAEVNSADESDADAVNVDSNGRKVRMLSQLTSEEGPSSSKYSKSESDERCPLTSNKRSLVFSSSKASLLKTEGKKLTMLTDLENQNHELPEGAQRICEHQKEKKKVSLHEKTQEKIRSSGHLKHWVRSKRRDLKRVVCKGNMDVSKDNVVHNGDPSTCTSCDPTSTISTETFVHSPSEGGEICQAATGAAKGDQSTLQILSYKNCCPSAGKKLLTLGKKFSSKSHMAKKVSKLKDVEEAFPREYREELPSRESGKQMELVCRIDNRCSRTCNFSVPITLQAGKETCSLGCSKGPLETKDSKLENYLSLVEGTALDSEEKLNNENPLTVKKRSGPNELPHDTMDRGDSPQYMHFGGAKEPDGDEMTLDVHNPLAPTSYSIGDPTKVSSYGEMATVSAECLPSSGGTQLEPCMENLAEALQSELSREDSSFSNQGSNKAAHDTSQTVDEKINEKSKQNVSEAKATISQVNTFICQGKGESFTSSQEDVFVDAFVGKSTAEQNRHVNLGCLNFIGSEYQCNLFDILAAQVTPTSTRLGARVSTAVEPICRVIEPESCFGPSKMNICSPCQDSDSTRKSCSHFFEDQQLASPNGIPGWQNISPDLPFEASMVFTGTQHFQVNKTSCCQGYHTSSQREGICCRGSCAVSAGQHILAQNSNPYPLFIDGCVHGENGFPASTCLSDLVPELPQDLQAATADKMTNIIVRSPFLGIPTKSQTDAIQRPHGGTASQVSDHCKVQPTANCVLRLMGKNLMVASKGEADAVLQHVSTPCSKTNHPNSEYVRNLGFSGTCGCKPNQLLSTPSVQEDPFVFTHFQHETLSRSPGNFGNPRIPLPTQQKSYRSIHNDNLARFSSQTVFDAKSENYFQHRTLFQSCGQLNSFNAQNLEFAHKLEKEALARFGARSAQEVIILDDSPEPCRSD
ncbi:uncharacterized protein LOC116258676 [Nymphaea colorata]|nr:uncharacterized protein LOC116258676 [Nymphaea colorata]XP_031491831.1 uncharacterized protein LOC116258676 [Nymphaea colorata]XP_031491832.1 uncharacterized protein LOC116258676 [Nymphaea colorata]